MGGLTMSESPGSHAHRHGVCLSGVGAEEPPNVVTTAEVEERAGLARFGFEPGWLERVTGVRERRFADPDVLPSRLAIVAGGKALADAGVTPQEVDTLVFCGITRDALEPATANVVAEGVGTREARVFDLSNACNGFIDAIDVADSLIRTGKARRVLVTTGERASWSINWQPRTTEEVLRSVAGLVVGDGGGAVVVEACDDPARGLREREFRSDPAQWRHAVGGRFRPQEPCPHCAEFFDFIFWCEGRDLLSAAITLMVPAMYEVTVRTGWTPRDIDVAFCHLPTLRFLERSVADHTGPAVRALQKLWITVDRFGNASTASLAIGMAEARAAGKLVPGAKVILLAPASGVSAAAMTLVW
jgi:3-oxoacyl-(acyl-carrier-protein) synthase III